MKIPEERLPIAAAFLNAEQIRVECVGQLARATCRIDRVGGSVQWRPVLAHEVVPRGVVTGGTCDRERKILAMKRREISFEIAFGRSRRLERVRATLVQRALKLLDRQFPSRAIRG